MILKPRLILNLCIILNMTQMWRMLSAHSQLRSNWGGIPPRMASSTDFLELWTTEVVVMGCTCQTFTQQTMLSQLLLVFLWSPLSSLSASMKCALSLLQMSGNRSIGLVETFKIFFRGSLRKRVSHGIGPRLWGIFQSSMRINTFLCHRATFTLCKCKSRSRHHTFGRSMRSQEICSSSSTHLLTHSAWENIPLLLDPHL
mmetsp:Transcript_9162/g.33828  ORF Transcript_9162/g.33828 Transcript_9162/m.33828 type:complete len:200 (-) Transcript_9162:558-1157(-)